jgi:hypothetical protein
MENEMIDKEHNRCADWQSISTRVGGFRNFSRDFNRRVYLIRDPKGFAEQ